jgi:hypothetical protein
MIKSEGVGKLRAGEGKWAAPGLGFPGNVRKPAPVEPTRFLRSNLAFSRPRINGSATLADKGNGFLSPRSDNAGIRALPTEE